MLQLKTKKKKVFTHNDMDGTACGIVATLAFGKSQVDVEYLSYDKINSRIKEFLESSEIDDYDQVYITDISVDMSTAKQLDIMNSDEVRIRLLDHHSTAIGLNEYHWANVKLQHEGVRACGAQLLFSELHEILKDRLTLMSFHQLKNFVENVRMYDTWDWEGVDEHPFCLNMLFGIIGRNEFITRFTDDPSPEFTAIEFALVGYERERMRRYIEAASNDVRIINHYRYDSNCYRIDDVRKYSVGVVFADQYLSILCNEIAKNNSAIDIVAAIDMTRKVVTYRTVKDDTHVGEFAERRFGGGGHAKASGHEITEDTIWKLIEDVFAQERREKY